MESALARPVVRVLPSLGLVLVTGGLLLLGWVAYSVLRPLPAAPYRYELQKEGSSPGSGKLDTKDWPDLRIEKYAMLVDGVDKPVAQMHVARRGEGGPVMIDWRNLSEEPMGSLDVSFPEVASLAQAIDKHTSQKAIVLGWWDTSRQIRLLTGRVTPFDAYLAEPAITPSFWRAQGRSIDRYEREFWGAVPGADVQRKFAQFADALSADVATGVARLQELVGGQEAYIAVSVSDIYKLGLMRPQRLGVASRVFPLQSNIHGDINAVDLWARQKKYAGYELQKLSGNAVRAYFLTDARSGDTLLAHMLPFTTSRPTGLRAVQLVYQHGDYWVYQIPAVDSTQEERPHEKAE